MPSIAIIIVNWNTADLTRGCLRAIEAGSPKSNWQVFVVDNASTDGSAAMIRSEFPAVQLIANAENVGFGKANNQAIQQTDADVVVLLNSDALASVEAIEGLAAHFENAPTLGAASPLLLTSTGIAQAYAFGGEPTIAYLLKRAFARVAFRRALHEWHPRTQIHVDWVAGTCLAARGNLLRRLGGFDEDFFMYFEDADLCRRIRAAGFGVVYDPAISITHLGGQSAKRSPRAIQAYRDSLQTYFKKHYSRPAQLALRLLLPIYARL